MSICLSFVRRPWSALSGLIRTSTAVLLALWAVASPDVQAQVPYPTKPLHWFVPYSAGGGSDVVARVIGAQLTSDLGQAVLIENRPGASTMIAAQALAKSAPDGYTLLSADNSTLVFNPALYTKLPYDPASDFAPVSLIARVPLLLVANPTFAARDAKGFVEQARQRPGGLSYGSPGAGSPHHLAMELLTKATSTSLVHVPYRGAAPAVQDLMGGQIPVMVLDTAVALPLLRSGRIKALGTFSATRLASLPDIPTLAEQGISDVVAFAWIGVVVPAGTPSNVVSALSAAIRKASQGPPTATLRELGVEALSSSPEQMREFIREESTRWQALIRERNIHLE